MKLNDFLWANALISDPFAHTNAEEEELLTEYFVPPPYFNSVRGDSAAPKSTIVFAPRGGGKTAQRRVLEEDSRSIDSQYLCVLYDRFLVTPDGRAVPVDDHINQICLRVLLAILVSLESEGLSGRVLLDEDREFLTNECGLLDAVDSETFENLIGSLKSDTRRMGDWLREHSGPVKGVVASLLAKRGIELDPTLPWSAQVGKAKESSPLARLKRLILVCEHIGFESIYVLIDRLDETAQTNTNPIKAIELVSSMLLDLKIMELPGLAIKVFAWDLSQDHYHEMGGRRDRVKEFELTWKLEALDEMISRRLIAYSSGNVESLNQLLASDVDIDFQRLACYLAHGSPRDLIRLCGHVVSEHLDSVDASGDVSEGDIWNGVRRFSTEICDERAKKYLPDLMRLDAYRFTQNKVANDYLKISKQATQSKVVEWRRTAMVDKITEVQDARFRPQHLYGVIDPRLAIHLRPSLDCRDVLEYFALECSHCGTVNYSDENNFVCKSCNRDLKASKTESLMSRCLREP